MTPRRQLRAAVIGAGLMGRWHAHAIRRVGGVVRAVVDTSLEQAQALASRHHAEASTSLQPIMNSVDIVHVCTPVDSHEPLAAEAIDAGRHVLVEKPLAATSAATRALVARAAARGVLIAPVHQFCWQDGAQRVFASLPALGAIRHIDFIACSAGATSSGMDPDEVALDVLPHPLSLIARVHPQALAGPWTIHRPASGELRLTTMAGQATVSVLISMSGRPTVNALRIVAEHASARLDLFHGFAVIEPGAVSRGRKIVQPFASAGATLVAAASNLIARAIRQEPAYPGLRPLIAEFYAAVAESGRAPVANEDTVAIADAIDAIRATVAA